MNRQDLEFMRTLKLTDGQLEYLQDLVMFAYEMNVPEQKGWDIQTFDNLVDEVGVACVFRLPDVSLFGVLSGD